MTYHHVRQFWYLKKRDSLWVQTLKNNNFGEIWAYIAMWFTMNIELIVWNHLNNKWPQNKEQLSNDNQTERPRQQVNNAFINEELMSTQLYLTVMNSIVKFDDYMSRDIKPIVPVYNYSVIQLTFNTSKRRYNLHSD